MDYIIALIVLVFIYYYIKISKIFEFDKYFIIKHQLDDLIKYKNLNRLQDCFLFDKEAKLIMSKDYQIAYDLVSKDIIIYNEFNDEMDINLNLKNITLNPILLYYYIRLKLLIIKLNIATLEIR